MGALSINRRVNQGDYSEFMPQFPAFTLISHVCAKGLQAGSVLGLCVVLPILQMRGRGASSFSQRWTRVMSSLPLVSGATATAMLYGMVEHKGIDEVGVDDRAYRLSHNEGQLQLDKWSAVGTAGGVMAGVLAGRSVVAGALTGTAFGVVSYILAKNVAQMPPTLDRGEKK